MRSTRFLTWALAASMLVVGGCSSGLSAGNSEPQSGRISPPESADGAAADGARDINRWVLPSDRYAPPSKILERAAMQSAVVACLAQHGIQMPQAKYNLEAGPGETRSATDQRIFNVAVAQKYGYGEAPDPRVDTESRVRVREFRQNMTDEQRALEDQCYDQVEQDLGVHTLDTQDGESAVQAWQWGVPESPDPLSPELKPHVEQWRACMAPLGIPDLNEYPEFGPPAVSLAEKWGYMQDIRPEDLPPATPEEIAVAVADATCQETSGYTEALYNAQWDIEQRYIDEHKQDLENMLATYQQYEQKLRDVIHGR